MYSYRVHGTAIDSEIELSELRPRHDGPPAATIEIRPPRNFSESAIADRLTIEGYGQVIAAENGTRMLVLPEPDASIDAVRQLVYGPGFRLLFTARGAIALHGSAVSIDGTAVAFLGDSGIGKSTMAAAFDADSHDVLTDDLVVIKNPATPYVYPGFTSIRLDAETAARIGLAGGESPAENDRKHHYRPTSGVPANDRYPLERLYLIGVADETSITIVESGEALFNLMYHSYNEYDANDVTRNAVSTHFDRCSTLAQSVSVRRLDRPRTVDALSDVVTAVESDLSGEADDDTRSEPYSYP